MGMNSENRDMEQLVNTESVETPLERQFIEIIEALDSPEVTQDVEFSTSKQYKYLVDNIDDFLKLLHELNAQQIRNAFVQTDQYYLQPDESPTQKTEFLMLRREKEWDTDDNTSSESDTMTLLYKTNSHDSSGDHSRKVASITAGYESDLAIELLYAVEQVRGNEFTKFKVSKTRMIYELPIGPDGKAIRVHVDTDVTLEKFDPSNPTQAIESLPNMNFVEITIDDDGPDIESAKEVLRLFEVEELDTPYVDFDEIKKRYHSASRKPVGFEKVKHGSWQGNIHQPVYFRQSGNRPTYIYGSLGPRDERVGGKKFLTEVQEILDKFDGAIVGDGKAEIERGGNYEDFSNLDPFIELKKIKDDIRYAKVWKKNISPNRQRLLFTVVIFNSGKRGIFFHGRIRNHDSYDRWRKLHEKR